MEGLAYVGLRTAALAAAASTVAIASPIAGIAAATFLHAQTISDTAGVLANVYDGAAVGIELHSSIPSMWPLGSAGPEAAPTPAPGPTSATAPDTAQPTTTSPTTPNDTNRPVFGPENISASEQYASAFHDTADALRGVSSATNLLRQGPTTNVLKMENVLRVFGYYGSRADIVGEVLLGDRGVAYLGRDNVNTVLNAPVTAAAAAVSAAQAVGSATVSAAQTVGSAATTAAQTVGSAATTAAQAVGSATVSAAQTVGSATGIAAQETAAFSAASILEWFLSGSQYE